MADDDNFVPTRWTYEGRRLDSKNKLLTAWKREGAESASWFAGKTVAGPIIGGVYEILTHVRDDGVTARFGSAKYVEPIKDELLVARLRAEDRAANIEYEAIAATKKLAKDNGDIGDLTLRELRKLMHNSMPARRTAMASVVLSYLNMGL